MRQIVDHDPAVVLLDRRKGRLLPVQRLVQASKLGPTSLCGTGWKNGQRRRWIVEYCALWYAAVSFDEFRVGGVHIADIWPSERS